MRLCSTPPLSPALIALCLCALTQSLSSARPFPAARSFVPPPQDRAASDPSGPIDAATVVVAGRSLGGAVAIALTAKIRGGGSGSSGGEGGEGSRSPAALVSAAAAAREGHTHKWFVWR